MYIIILALTYAEGLGVLDVGATGGRVGLDAGDTQLIIDFPGTGSSIFEAHTLILIPCMARPLSVLAPPT